MTFLLFPPWFGECLLLFILTEICVCQLLNSRTNHVSTCKYLHDRKRKTRVVPDCTKNIIFLRELHSRQHLKTASSQGALGHAKQTNKVKSVCSASQLWGGEYANHSRLRQRVYWTVCNKRICSTLRSCTVKTRRWLPLVPPRCNPLNDTIIATFEATRINNILLRQNVYIYLWLTGWGS